MGMPTWALRPFAACDSCAAAGTHVAAARINNRMSDTFFFMSVPLLHSRDLYQRGRCFKFFDHVRRPDASACERLLAIRRRRAAHIAFHVSEARATRAPTHMSAAGAGGE